MNIDELVVTLNLDPSGFTKGQRDALDQFKKTDDEFQKRLKDLEEQNKKAGASFGDITNAAEGLFTVIAGAGMASFARDTMNSVSATGRLAHNIGETSSELSTFGRAIERNGGSAQAAMGSLKGFSDQITRLNTLGQGSPELFNFLGTIGARDGSGPLETFMRFAEWAERHKDNPQLVNLIGQQGGFDQDSINEAMKGRVQVLKDLAAASRGAVTPEQVAALTKLQDAWVGLDQAIEKTGRDVVANAAPALANIAGVARSAIENNQKLADALGGVLTAITGLMALKPALWVLRILGIANPYTLAIATSAGVATAVSTSETGKGFANAMHRALPWTKAFDDKVDSWFGAKTEESGVSSASRAFGSQAEKEAFIRASAIKAGIDPDVAMAVARSEGFNNFKSAIPGEQSFGAFQLHVTPGGRGRAVGDQFQSQTGLDPSDPANEHQSIMFALDWAKRHGWQDFHGAANTGIGDRQGIGDINVTVTTDSKDPREHGRLVANEVRSRMSGAIATQANTGLN